ncbi:MAG: hypothetical protein JSS20_10355 [Proteobacteria bacterium]|nr:hypothetical protein [Pseudomonadota bacterium]
MKSAIEESARRFASNADTRKPIYVGPPTPSPGTGRRGCFVSFCAPSRIAGDFAELTDYADAREGELRRAILAEALGRHFATVRQLSEAELNAIAATADPALLTLRALHLGDGLPIEAREGRR